jgi:Ca2+-binding RTX toxin-like protein
VNRFATVAACVVVTLAAATAAQGRSSSTRTGEIRLHTSPGPVISFEPAPATAQNLLVADAEPDLLHRNKGWTITTLAPDTTIGWFPPSGQGVCDEPFLLFYDLPTWRCDLSLNVDLGDLDDRFRSTAANTYDENPNDGIVPGLVVDGGSGRDTIVAGPLPDTVHGGSGNDTLDGGLGDDRLLGEAGDDFIDGRDGTDVIDGGDGVDTTDWGGSEGVIVTLGDQLGNDGHADEGDQVLNVENAYGTEFADRIAGSAFANRLLGSGGADALSGLGGNDWLQGGNGNDVLAGGSGTDKLEGGNGADKLSGQAGDDQLFGNDGNDTVEGGGGADRLTAGAGDDILRGGTGADILDGGPGADTIYANEADASVDVVKCGDGNDTVYLAAGDHADSDCENVIRS